MSSRRSVRWHVCQSPNGRLLLHIGVYGDGEGVVELRVAKQPEQPVLTGIPTLQDKLLELGLDSRFTSDI